MADYKYICKSEDKNVADKKYVVLRYAKQYALKHKTDIEDLVTGEIEIPHEKAMPFEEMSYSYRVNRVLLPKMGFEPLAETYKF